MSMFNNIVEISRHINNINIVRNSIVYLHNVKHDLYEIDNGSPVCIKPKLCPESFYRNKWFIIFFFIFFIQFNTSGKSDLRSTWTVVPRPIRTPVVRNAPLISFLTSPNIIKRNRCNRMILAICPRNFYEKNKQTNQPVVRWSSKIK